MTRRNQACTLGALLLLTAMMSGCGSDNQKEAKIDATVPTDGLSSQERRERAGSGVNAKSAGYPTPGGAPGGSRSK